MKVVDELSMTKLAANIRAVDADSRRITQPLANNNNGRDNASDSGAIRGVEGDEIDWVGVYEAEYEEDDDDAENGKNVLP